MDEASSILREVTISKAVSVIFEYMYRDASNYKAIGSIILSGAITEEEEIDLRNCLESGEFFVAEQVGIPSLAHRLRELSHGANDDDHAWHEFVGIDRENSLPRSFATHGLTSDLMAAFRSAKGDWHPEYSPNFWHVAIDPSRCAGI